MYYHIIMKSKSDKYYGEYKTDLSKEQLISRYIEPYDKGEVVMMNGKSIDTLSLERVTITETNLPVEHYISQVKFENQMSSVAIIGGPSYTYQAIGKGKDVTDDFIGGPAGYKLALQSTPSSSDGKASNSNFKKVFIVHGHDETAQTKAARFVEKLGLEAIILHEQVSAGRTIIEKIEHYSDVDFAIVLYTPDDVGNAKGKSENLSLRARQNVVFEHGYLISKLGRERVAALVDGQIELPNDISGVVYINIDSANAWHLTLAKEMKQAGYKIDMNDL